MTGSAYCLRSNVLVLFVALSSFAGQLGCSGDAPNSGTTNGGNTSIGGGSSAGGANVGGSTSSNTGSGVCAFRPSSCYPMCEGGVCDCYCPNTGGASAGVGGQSSSGGAAHVGGNSAAGAGGVCSSGCNATSTMPSVTCGTLPVFLSCMGPFPSNLSTIMSANGCTNVPINSVAYCCPAAILTTCR